MGCETCKSSSSDSLDEEFNKIKKILKKYQ